jgi:recombinational DNA repair ATPase RecF
MIRLRRLTIKGFRGARFDLQLDFTDARRSLAVFGENASGKSTITDAMEWFLLGRIDHLWREDCKEAALRHVLCAEGEPCEVTVEFSNPALGATKNLGADLRVTCDNRSAGFQAFQEKIKSERVILRHNEITNIVGKSKGEKRQWIARIIGYQEITDFRNAVQSARNALQGDPNYKAARQLADNAQSELFRLAKHVIESPESLFAKVNAVIAPFDLGFTVSDKPSFEHAIKALSDRISAPEFAKLKIQLGEIKGGCEAIVPLMMQLAAARDAFIGAYSQLSANRAAVRQLSIGKFLGTGRQLIASGTHAEQSCPFCLTPYDLEKLREEIEVRVATIAKIQGQYEENGTLKVAFINAAVGAMAACKALAGYAELEKFSVLKAAAARAAAVLATWIEIVNSSYAAFEPVELAPDGAELINIFPALATAQVSVAESEVEKLHLSKHEQNLIETITLLNDLKQQFMQYLKNSRIAQAFERQILSLSAIFDRFVPVQSKALQSVLDRLSADVSEFYTVLHPKENVDKVRLAVVGEEGIEFEYEFHGKRRSPPMKYLSESHLNSLGICLFLASARLFNKEARFLLLDDIVTSFDQGHRRRLLRLLGDAFADWQIILLTHERFWFELIQKEFQPLGWLFKEAKWDAENGVRLSGSAGDLREVIAEKRKKYDVSNDVRKLLEASLKEICQALEVKMAFRSNDENERRMSGELLSELRATVNRKCSSLKSHPSFAQLEGSNLTATVGSHNNPGEVISSGDIDVALSDIAALTGLFTCEACGRYVEAKRSLAGKDFITCKCGKKELEWKS